MNFVLQDCLDLVASNDAFVHQRKMIDGHTVDLFNYRLAAYSDFVSVPFGLEMRGVCFVDGVRYLGLNKFFNLNENESTQYKDLQDKQIVSVTEKADGSLIRFVKIGDKVYAKSKMSFESPQAIAAQKLYETDSELNRFVDWSLKNGFAAFFEYVAPDNQIVVLYNDAKLVLHSVRYEINGDYYDNNSFNNISKCFNVSLITQYDYSLDKLITFLSELEDCEGFVVRFSDGQQIKLKTDWYNNLHGLLTEKVYMANHVCRFILEETFDDVLAQIPQEMTSIRENLLDTQTKISHWFNSSVKDAETIMSDFTGDRKEWALRNKAKPMFPIAVRCLYGISDVSEQVKEFGLKKTYHLEEAKTFLESL